MGMAVYFSETDAKKIKDKQQREFAEKFSIRSSMWSSDIIVENMTSVKTKDSDFSHLKLEVKDISKVMNELNNELKRREKGLEWTLNILSKIKVDWYWNWFLVTEVDEIRKAGKKIVDSYYTIYDKWWEGLYVELDEKLSNVSNILNKFPNTYQEKEYLGEEIAGDIEDIVKIRYIMVALEIALINKIELQYS